MANMNLTALEDALDQHFGKIGTPQRDHFERDVTKALHTYRIKEAIKSVHMGQPLTHSLVSTNAGGVGQPANNRPCRGDLYGTPRR